MPVVAAALASGSQHRGQWLWVDDGDRLTGRALLAVLFFFVLTDTGTPDPMPLVTIPA